MSHTFPHWRLRGSHREVGRQHGEARRLEAVELAQMIRRVVSASTRSRSTGNAGSFEIGVTIGWTTLSRSFLTTTARCSGVGMWPPGLDA